MATRMSLPKTLAMVCAWGALLGNGIALGQPEHTGQTQEPLVTPNPPIDQQTQRKLGLLTLNNPEGSCSASMLNNYWAITAAHCVYSTTYPCKQFAANQISLTSNWSGNVKTAQVLQVITYGTPTSCPAAGAANLVGKPNDIALLQAGLHDFDRYEAQPMKLEDQRPTVNMSLTSYGRGLNALAYMAGTGVNIPAASDGQYRWANFDIDSATPESSDPPVFYSFAGNRGATVAAGDSGGPAYDQVWDDPLSAQRKLEYRLLGVHSWCTFTCLPGAPSCTWKWAASVRQCSDAAILPVRSQILAAIQAVPPDDSFAGQFPTSVPDSVLRMKRALYALNVNEPLVAPPGAAVDTVLGFKRCRFDCPVTDDLRQWGYDPDTHRLVHVASGKCITTSWAIRGDGAPLILSPCTGAPNQKWTIVAAVNSDVWSLKSDSSGMCLEARIGRTANSNVVMLPYAATLIQTRCNGSDAQRFASVDAGWAERNKPH